MLHSTTELLGLGQSPQFIHSDNRAEAPDSQQVRTAAIVGDYDLLDVNLAEQKCCANMMEMDAVPSLLTPTISDRFRSFTQRTFLSRHSLCSHGT